MLQNFHVLVALAAFAALTADPHKPGEALAGQVIALAPGDSFYFEAWENGLSGLGSMAIEDEALAPYVHITRSERIPRCPGPGGKALNGYHISAADNAPVDRDVTIYTTGEYQTRTDPNWSFRFTLHLQR